MCRFKSISLAAVLLGFLLVGCSKSNDQKRFEKEAYSKPQHITELNANGQPPESGQTDPDDWRISPAYKGLIEINKKAFPNPVFINSRFQIELHIRYANNLSGIDVYAFQYPDEISPIETIGEMQIYDQSFPNVRIDAAKLPTDKRNNLYRIIFLDQMGDVITYGDVQVTSNRL